MSALDKITQVFGGKKWITKEEYKRERSGEIEFLEIEPLSPLEDQIESFPPFILVISKFPSAAESRATRNSVGNGYFGSGLDSDHRDYLIEQERLKNASK